MMNTETQTYVSCKKFMNYMTYYCCVLAAALVHRQQDISLRHISYQGIKEEGTVGKGQEVEAVVLPCMTVLGFFEPDK